MKALINIFHLVQLLGLETTMIIQYLTGNIPFKKRWRSQALSSLHRNLKQTSGTARVVVVGGARHDRHRAVPGDWQPCACSPRISPSLLVVVV